MNKKKYLRSVSILFILFLFVFTTHPGRVTGETPPNHQVEPVGRGLGEDIPDWQARLELARVLSHVKRYDESLAEYRKVLREKPDLTAARLELARVLYWSGKPEEALQHFSKLAPADMNSEDLITMADIYAAQKDYDKAIALYTSHLEKMPANHNVRLKLAEILSWSKRHAEALAEFETILQARPDDIQVRRKYAIVLIWADRKLDAIKELQKTLAPAKP